MERKQFALTAVVCLSIVALVGMATVPVVANHDSQGETHYSFEENLSNNWENIDSQSSQYQGTVQEGNYSLEQRTSTQTSLNTIDAGFADNTTDWTAYHYMDSTRSGDQDGFMDVISYINVTDGSKFYRIGVRTYDHQEVARIDGNIVKNSEYTADTAGDYTDYWRGLDVTANGTAVRVQTDDCENSGNPCVDIASNFTDTFDNSGNVHIKIETRENGIDDQTQTVYYDNLTFTGSATGGANTDDENLELDVKPYMKHGQSQDYTVRYNDSGTWTDVSDSATVESENPDVVEVYQSNQTLVATSNESVNELVYVNATYDGLYTEENVTVANATVSNLDILPGFLWKFNAVINNDNVRVLIVALAAAVVATKFATAFTGIGAFVIVSVVAWTGDYYATGPMIVSVLFGIMVGLNLALNVDRSLR